jgi:hypothetical protein
MSDFTSPGGSRRADDGAIGARTAEQSRNGNGTATYRLRVDPSRSMKAVTGEVSALLDGMEEEQRRSSALLASELIAQVVSPAPGWNEQPIGLTVQVRADAVCIEAVGPVAPTIQADATDEVVADDPLADWGTFVIDRLADRWGLAGGTERTIWAEVATAA